MPTTGRPELDSGKEAAIADSPVVGGQKSGLQSAGTVAMAPRLPGLRGIASCPVMTECAEDRKQSDQDNRAEQQQAELLEGVLSNKLKATLV